MSHGDQLDRLASRWAETPDRGIFAALAEGLRKHGALGEASAIALSGLSRFPEHLPGLMVLARIREDERDFPSAEAALKSALSCDPSHPVVLETLARIAEATGRPGDAKAWTAARDAALPDIMPSAASPQVLAVDIALEPSPRLTMQPDLESEPLVYSDEGMEEEGAEFGDLSEPLLTESIAMLYLGQGHLDRALEVFHALAAKDPGNASLCARRDALVVELAGRRPRPYDAAKSGGRSVSEWLGVLAAAKPQSHNAPAGYDAFFQAPPPPPDETADLGAFQAWLKELGR